MARKSLRTANVIHRLANVLGGLILGGISFNWVAQKSTSPYILWGVCVSLTTTYMGLNPNAWYQLRKDSLIKYTLMASLVGFLCSLGVITYFHWPTKTDYPNVQIIAGLGSTTIVVNLIRVILTPSSPIMVPIYKSECDAFLKDHYDDEEMMTDQISTVSQFTDMAHSQEDLFVI